MTRYLIDTNVVSNLSKLVPSPALTAWLGARPDEALFISTLTLAEIQRGILRLPAGRRRDGLAAWMAGPMGPAALFAGRILDFDTAAALAWARLMADGERAGRPRSPLDMIVAAIAAAHACVVVTDNERDFAGLPFVNPLRPPEG